ncbi:hypothetical protein [Pedobacter sp. G11]|nr:hypothetical protein [Pedobacter sp. G11]
MGTIDFDLRPRPQFGLTYQNYGLYLAYSVGTENHQDGSLVAQTIG